MESREVGGLGLEGRRRSRKLVVDLDLGREVDSSGPDPWSALPLFLFVVLD